MISFVSGHSRYGRLGRLPTALLSGLLWHLLATPWPATAQQASGELYGEFRYSYNYADDGEAWRWGVVNNASRLGVRGEVSENGTTAFVDLQIGVAIDTEGSNVALTNRYYLAGVRGTFGTVAVGRQTPAYKAVGVRLDPFYDTSTLSTAGAVPETGLFAGASFGLSPLNNGFADRTIAYTSPTFAGLTANAAVQVDSGSDHDAAGGLTLRQRGFEAGVQYYDAGSGRAWAPAAVADRAVRAHGSYARSGSFAVGVSWEQLQAADVDDTQEFVYLAGRFNPAAATQLAASVGWVEDGAAIQEVSGTAVNAGVTLSFLPQVQVYAVYSWLDRRDGADRSNIGAGLIYRFRVAP